MIANTGMSMATISESVDETSSVSTWNQESNQKFSMMKKGFVNKMSPRRVSTTHSIKVNVN